jgi:hypothetical protein
MKAVVSCLSYCVETRGQKQRYQKNPERRMIGHAFFSLNVLAAEYPRHAAFPGNFERTIPVRLAALPAAQGCWPFFPDPPYIGGGGQGLTIRELIEEQRRRLGSGNPVERLAAALLIPSVLATPPPTARQPDRATFAGRGLGADEPAPSRIGHLPSGLGSASRLARR